LPLADVQRSILAFPQRWTGAALETRVLLLPTGDPTIAPSPPSGLPRFAGTTWALRDGRPGARCAHAARSGGDTGHDAVHVHGARARRCARALQRHRGAISDRPARSPSGTPVAVCQYRVSQTTAGELHERIRLRAPRVRHDH